MVHFFFKSNSPSELACKFETNVKVVIIITIIFLIIVDLVYYNEKQNKIRINQNYSLNVA